MNNLENNFPDLCLCVFHCCVENYLLHAVSGSVNWVEILLSANYGIHYCGIWFDTILKYDAVFCFFYLRLSNLLPLINFQDNWRNIVVGSKTHEKKSKTKVLRHQHVGIRGWTSEMYVNSYTFAITSDWKSIKSY